MGLSGDELAVHKDALDMLVRQELSIICTRIDEGRMNSTAAQAHVKKWRTHWVEATKLISGNPRSTKGALEFEMVAEGPERYIKAKSKELARLLSNIRHLHRDDTTKLIKLADGAIRQEDVIRLLEEQTREAELAAEHGRQALGRKAHQGAEVLDLFDV